MSRDNMITTLKIGVTSTAYSNDDVRDIPFPGEYL